MYVNVYTLLKYCQSRDYGQGRRAGTPWRASVHLGHCAEDSMDDVSFDVVAARFKFVNRRGPCRSPLKVDVGMGSIRFEQTKQLKSVVGGVGVVVVYVPVAFWMGSIPSEKENML